jgi:predicted phosphoribosyltransferase
MSHFADRREAGRKLAEALRGYAGRQDLLVLALPRGGVPVGYEVALRLGAPLDVFVVRKLGVPGHEEFAMGAVASGDVRVLHARTIAQLGIPDPVIEAVTEKERHEIVRRERQYRGDRPPPAVAGMIVILVDDGLATGATMQAAVEALRLGGPAFLVVAVPVGAPDSCAELRGYVDEVICAITPEPLHGVSRWYGDFTQTTDEEVRDLLNRARDRAAGAAARDDRRPAWRGSTTTPSAAPSRTRPTH